MTSKTRFIGSGYHWVGIWDPIIGVLYPTIGCENRHYEIDDFLTVPLILPYKELLVGKSNYWIPAMEYAEDKLSRYRQYANETYFYNSISKDDVFIFDGYQWNLNIG